jgi:DNA invertase Pin-like site-specific DNA recombinase
MKKTAAIYTRVAVEDQKNDTALKELRQYCTRMDWDIIEYKEKPSLVKVRPLLDLLMHDARQKKCEVVVVWKLGRFAQSTRHFLEH